MVLAVGSNMRMTPVLTGCSAAVSLGAKTAALWRQRWTGRGGIMNKMEYNPRAAMISDSGRYGGFRCTMFKCLQSGHKEWFGNLGAVVERCFIEGRRPECTFACCCPGVFSRRKCCGCLSHYSSEQCSSHVHTATAPPATHRNTSSTPGQPPSKSPSSSKTPHQRANAAEILKHSSRALSRR